MVKTNRPEMIKKSKMYFDPWESIFEGNPMLILERGEKVMLPPMLIMQGELDTNVPWQISEKMGQLYRAAGGNSSRAVALYASGYHGRGVPRTTRIAVTSRRAQAWQAQAQAWQPGPWQAQPMMGQW